MTDGTNENNKRCVQKDLAPKIASLRVCQSNIINHSKFTNRGSSIQVESRLKGTRQSDKNSDALYSVANVSSIVANSSVEVLALKSNVG